MRVIVVLQFLMINGRDVSASEWPDAFLAALMEILGVKAERKILRTDAKVRVCKERGEEMWK
jgi:hypothetical protein